MTKGMVRDKVKAVDQIHADPGLPINVHVPLDVNRVFQINYYK